MFEGFERKVVLVDGLDIACAVGGKGAPILLLHGFPQTMAMWARVAPQLANEFTVVCSDLRGYGASAKPKCLPDRSNYSFRAMAQDQLGLMRQLGFDRFHVIGHDRGGRTGHRMALDHPEAVISLSVIDIVPTYAMFMDTNRFVAGAYWRWYLLSQPEPFPERGWGAAKIADFDPEMIDAYRTAWRNPEMIHGSCSDYRAAASIDLDHDKQDFDKKVACPTLVFFGADGQMAKLFNIPVEWRKRCSSITVASLPGGHFFVDQFPAETAAILSSFLKRQAGP